MTVIGVLSDTHRTTIDATFTSWCKDAFSSCDLIVHAGDITDTAVLSVFGDKHVYAVAGNSCSLATKCNLPESLEFTAAGYNFAITHGSGQRHNITDRVFARFPHADCIFYGHSHIAAIDYYGETLLFNPGSFSSSGPFGRLPSYGLLKIDPKKKKGLHPEIHQISLSTSNF